MIQLTVINGIKQSWFTITIGVNSSHFRPHFRPSPWHQNSAFRRPIAPPALRAPFVPASAVRCPPCALWMRGEEACNVGPTSDVWWFIDPMKTVVLSCTIVKLEWQTNLTVVWGPHIVRTPIRMSAVMSWQMPRIWRFFAHDSDWWRKCMTCR